MFSEKATKIWSFIFHLFLISLSNVKSNGIQLQILVTFSKNLTFTKAILIKRNNSSSKKDFNTLHMWKDIEYTETRYEGKYMLFYIYLTPYVSSLFHALENSQVTFQFVIQNYVAKGKSWGINVTDTVASCLLCIAVSLSDIGWENDKSF